MDSLPLGLLNGVGVVTLTVILFWMLSTGRLCTGRELRDKDRTIDALRQAVSTRDAQLSLVLKETLPTANSVLTALRAAAGEQTE